MTWEAWSGGFGWTYDSVVYGYPCTTSTTTADCPADSISWYDVAMYANALSAAEGFSECYLSDGTDLAAAYLTDPYSCDGYRMPTEAEREYAARGGEDYAYSGSDTATAVAWFYDNAYGVSTYAHEVATLTSNSYGLYDMSGNVDEWTQDWYDSAHGGYGDGSPDVDPAGPVTGSGLRGIRDGTWVSSEIAVWVVYRVGATPGHRGTNTGARLTRSVP